MKFTIFTPKTLLSKQYENIFLAYHQVLLLRAFVLSLLRLQPFAFVYESLLCLQIRYSGIAGTEGGAWCKGRYWSTGMSRELASIRYV